jgi:hypothetical protein
MRLFRKLSENQQYCEAGKSHEFPVTQFSCALFCGCDVDVGYFEVSILILVLLHVSPQYILEVLCENFPYSVEEVTFEAVIYMLQEDDNCEQRSVMLRNNIT